MKEKKVFILIAGLMIFGTFITLLLTGLIFGFEEVPPIFVAFHLIAFLYVILLFLIFIPLEKLLLLSLDPDIKEIYKSKKVHLRPILFICLTLFFVGSWIMNHYGFDYHLNLLSIISNLGLVLLIIGLVSIMLRPRRKYNFLILFSASILISSLLFSLINHNPDNQLNSPSTEALKSLPYARWTLAESTLDKQGVILHNRQKAFKGINIYSSRNLSTAYLMDMSGGILHTWNVNISNPEDYEWPYVKLLKNGDLLEIARKKMLICMDWNSHTKWIRKISSHHDLDIDQSNNDIYTLTHDYEVVFHSLIPLPIGNEYITILSPEGKIKKNISLYKILKNEISSDRFERIIWWLLSPKHFAARIEMAIKPPRDVFARPTDIFHSNTVGVIDQDISPIIKRGHILYCSMRLDLIGVIDIEREKLIWSWGKRDLEGPHHPTPLENGNILIYDNGTRRGHTRILEVNPLTNRIEWQYVGNPPQSFFSKWGGASQRLPNGNTLLTESDRGRVFEITKDGEIVWEFYNPEMDKKNQTRATIYRMMKITDIENYPYLNSLKN